jgi:uncharacterized protein YlzI (FlbEa/FlbD family)
MRFIELPSSMDDNPVYINPEHVESVRVNEETGSTVQMVSGEKHYIALSVEEVRQKLLGGAVRSIPLG